jgi:hypothetical protein
MTSSRSWWTGKSLTELQESLLAPKKSRSSGEMEKKEADFKSSLGTHKLKESSKGNKILQEQQTQQVRVATSLRGR